MSTNKEKNRAASRRSGMQIMGQLIGQIKPLLPVMIVAIVLGVLGYLCAIFLTILAAFGLLNLLIEGLGFSTQNAVGLLSVAPKTLFLLLVVLAVCRGLLHYGEQYCNHFIAFKLLAILRGKVFAALRRLCPAKLEGKDRGNLISVITTDIELLEVFYAHTISPIAIAVCTSLIMVGFIGKQFWLAGLVALAGYLVVGLVIPLHFGKEGAEDGMEFRNCFGDLNSFVLDSLHGIDETIQYGCGEERREEMLERSEELNDVGQALNQLEAAQRSVTNGAILAFSFGMLALMLWQRQAGHVDMVALVVATVAMMGSFGPVTALAALANNLNQTLASGERVLSVLEEEPVVEEIAGAEVMESAAEMDVAAEVDAVAGAAEVNVAVGAEVFADAAAGFATGAEMIAGAPAMEARQVCFAYDEEEILKDFSLAVKAHRIVGLYGSSGSGKSTVLKLLMRFWDVNSGEIRIGTEDVRHIPTAALRETEGYVTQETHLFHDTIANNIAIGKLDATREEIIEAAKKAAIHDFIQGLPKGYDTQVGELGDTLSGGEAQRIGIARAFLHDAPILLLDEPTSNLDSLNEGIILKSLQQAAENKTVLLVSHRKSTMSVADDVIKMHSTRAS